MRPRRALSSLLAVALFCLDLGGAGWAEKLPALRELDALHARSARAEDVVLSFLVGGGYGVFEERELLFYGDGRAEERIWKSPSKVDQTPEMRVLFADVARVDALFRRVVESGLAGLDNDRLLALVQARYPNVADLAPGVDCSTADIVIRLFQRPTQSALWRSTETHLRLECVWAFARIYPDVPEACALTDLHAELVSLTRASQGR